MGQHHLCSEADATRKKMHEVMYNHQLEYDKQLAAFLKETETTLSNMRDRCSHLHREQGHHLQLLHESHTAPTPSAPTDPHGRLISDADTTHHCLLSGVLCLQKMAL